MQSPDNTVSLMKARKKNNTGPVYMNLKKILKKDTMRFLASHEVRDISFHIYRKFLRESSCFVEALEWLEGEGRARGNGGNFY